MAATARDYLVASGVLRPPGFTPAPWIDKPTLRLDDVGRQAAARTIERPSRDDCFTPQIPRGPR